MGTKKRILIVEDNRDSRELVAKILTARGYVVLEAHDGIEALQMTESERPDLILMDISLPKIDGHEATRRLKSDEKLCAIPVIALTAHAMKGDREKAMTAGCSGYITKPINIRELPDQIERFFKE
jgi:two-component system cell cycle response regulator DivK